MSGPLASLLASFLGALQGTISVLITLFSGYLAAHVGLLDRDTVQRISRLCSVIFLPCLIVEQMGPQLTVSNLKRLWIVPTWGFVSTLIGYFIGWLGQLTLKMPYWTIVACGRPNANALPLLLLQSLETTGVLDEVTMPGETVSELLDRAKSIILLNAIVQEAFTFQAAPPILKWDRVQRLKRRRSSQFGRAHLTPGLAAHSLPVDVQDPERVGLLQDHDYYDPTPDPIPYSEALDPIADQPNIRCPSALTPILKLSVRVMRFMSPPLIAAIVAFIVGMVPPLHRVFLDPDGALYSSITQSIKNLGELFVVLQAFIVGSELALAPHAKPGGAEATYSLTVRFIIMPALALLFVWETAGRGWYVDDKLVWFLLVLIPSGPSAMILATLSELMNVDQGPISSYLTISYLLSPFMAVICSVGLKVVEAAGKRT